jgi:alkylmercury lyase
VYSLLVAMNGSSDIPAALGGNDETPLLSYRCIDKERFPMRDIPLQDVITAHTGNAASDQLEEFLPLARFLLLRGSGPVSPERLATALHCPRAEVGALLQSSGLVIGPDGYIHLAPGPHQIQLDGETLSGWCALDTLLFPLLMGHATRVTSACAATGRPIRLTVTEHGITDLEPQAAVLSLRLPGETTEVENVQETICAYGHFFVDREHAATWPGLHPEAALLSVEEAARLAREIANVVRGYAEKAGS